MKAKNSNSMNVYIDEKGQVHSISFATKKAVAEHRSTLREKVKGMKTEYPIGKTPDYDYQFEDGYDAALDNVIKLLLEV